ncbi:MAG: tyrosine-type recombinase/integrase [Polymorphobacter sp.]|uniref:tyrosine-type recombinase/integrase n=1 Tax=Polymorphobacter sp. TaxID=1909290 RepID=UPI003A84EF5C
MARAVRDAKLDTRTARQKLDVSSKPHWRVVIEGGHIGYYRGARCGKWKARFRAVGTKGGYKETTLGEADDVMDANGETILSFAQAQEKARAWFMAASGVKRGGPYTVGDALDDYLEGFEGKSVYQTRNRIDVLIRPALGKIELAKLTADQISKWHKERADLPAMLRTAKHQTDHNVRLTNTPDRVRRRRSTANRDLTVLKAALNAAFRAGKVGSDAAWRQVKPFKKVEGVRLRYLSDAESRRLVNAADPEFRPMIMAALLTGARYGDLCGALVMDFDAAAGTLFLPDGKGGRRHVYLSDEGQAFLKQAATGKTPDQHLFTHPSGRAWRASEQARPLDEAVQRAKLDRVTFHDLRRTYGARLALAGVPMAVIAEAMGHKDERVTRRHYAHLSPSYVADQVRQHSAGLKIVEAGNVASLA